MATAAQAAPTKKAAPKSAPKKPAASRPYQIPTTGTLDRFALMKIASTALSTAPKDAFSDHPSAKYAGRHFLFAQRIKADGENDATVDATWTYDRALQVLTVALPKYSSAYTAYFSSEFTGSRVGQNAFGVKVNVREYSETTISVYANKSPPSKNGYKVEIQAPPEVAKALSKNIYVFIEGDLVSEDGAVASCNAATDGATIDDPVEVFRADCSVNANVTGIRFAAGDKVYGSWQDPAKEDDMDKLPNLPASPTGKVITRPDWVRKPTAEEFAQYYPERALRMEVRGAATLTCIVGASGDLANCSVETERPADYGFGDAALKLAPLMRMKPQTLDGAPVVGGTVTVPLSFTIPW